MTETVIFYLVFASQIFLFSYYFPGKLHQRMRDAITLYPPEKYPRLYPNRITEYHAFHKRFIVMNHILLAGGLLLMAAFFFMKVDVLGKLFAMIPWGFFMLQFIPFFILEGSAFNQIKWMRQSDKRTKRTANFHQVSVFDFTSKRELALVTLVLLISMIVFLFTNNPDFPIVNEWDGVVVLLATNVFFVWMVYWTLFRRKYDPYQDQSDREKMMLICVKSAVFTSIAMSVFMIIINLMDYFALEHMLSVVISLYCQIIAFYTMTLHLKNTELKNMNFEVYREEEDTTPSTSA